MELNSGEVRARRVLIAGRAEGPVCRLAAPISFWGGVDSQTGLIVDPRHPDCGRSITGTVLALPSAIGSSSSSAVMLELLRGHLAPAALLMGRLDAIVALGVVVGREMGYGAIPVLEVALADLERLPADGRVSVVDARITVS
jgi:predicted aconitase with swiveling domain